MEKAQGLPITTVVLIVICILVLVVIILFFLGGFGSGQSSVNTFQCQQQCQTINVQVKAGQVCGTTSFDNAAKNYCNANCNSKIRCVLPEGSYCNGQYIVNANECITCGAIRGKALCNTVTI